MVYRLQLTYDEFIYILEVKYIGGSTNGSTLTPGVYKIRDINLMLRSLLPNKVKLNTTIDDIRLKTNLTTNKTKRKTEKIFFSTFLGFTESLSEVLGDFEGFVQLIPGSYKSDRPSSITLIDKIHPRSDCINGSAVKPFYLFFCSDSTTRS